MAVLGIGFGNVPLTDPFDVLFARRICSDAQTESDFLRNRASPNGLVSFIGMNHLWKIEDYGAIFAVFYSTRCFISQKYDRSCVNNVSVNNELGVSAVLVRLPQFERI